MTRDAPRLIEHAFPLKQTSLDSVHQEIRLTAHANEFLTNGEGCVYVSTVKPPGSFGERVRSRSERGGSCFLRWGES